MNLVAGTNSRRYRLTGFLWNVGLIGILLISPRGVQSQSSDTTRIFLENYAVLADHGYDIGKITSDASLPFISNGSLYPAKADDYWIRLHVKNADAHPEGYLLRMYPNVKNTFYYFDIYTNKWVSRTVGVRAGERTRHWGAMPVVLYGNTSNTIYVKVSVEELRQFNKAVKPRIGLMKKAEADLHERNLWVAWIAGITVLLLFFLNNLYVYWSFREPAARYYLIAQCGGMIYLTAYWQFFHILLPCPVFTIGLHLFVNSYDLNSVLMHFGIILTLYGFTELTRSYLNTRRTFPRLDQLLRTGFVVYVIFSAVVMTINVFWFYLERDTLLLDNVLVLLLILLVIYTCIAGYRHKLAASAPFLFANLLPLAFMLGIPLYHVFVTNVARENLYLPDFVVVSQALGFSIALVAHTKAIQQELRMKEIEARKLEFDLKEVELHREMAALENQKMAAEMELEKERSELLVRDLDANQRELASMAMYTAQKNELLATLRKQLRSFDKSDTGSKKRGLTGVNSILRSDLYLDSDWQKFKLHFEKVHPRFFQDLRERYPNLSKNEERLSAYFHINLSTKEIAALFNIDPASVYRAKTRLTKKMSAPAMEDMPEEGDI